LNGYHTPRRSRLLRDFEQAARRVKPLIVSGYGVQAAEEWMGEARRDFDSLIPAIPYLGGKQPFTQFVISSAWCLAIYRTLDRRHEPLETLGGLILDLSEAFLKAYPAYLRPMFGRMTFTRHYLRQLRKRAEAPHRRQFPCDYVFNFVEGTGDDFDNGVDFAER